MYHNDNTIAGQLIPIVSTSGSNIVVSGDQTSTKFFMSVRNILSSISSRNNISNTAAAQSKTAVKEGRLQIRNWTVTYDNTGHFQVEVTPKARATSTKTFTGAIVGV